MNFQNPFITTGRETRTIYLGSMITLYLVWHVLQTAIAELLPTLGIARLGPTILVLWPAYCITVKRLQDTSRDSFSAVIIALIAIFGTIIYAVSGHSPTQQEAHNSLIAAAALTLLAAVAILSILPPKRRTNRYGTNPRKHRVKSDDIDQVENTES